MQPRNYFTDAAEWFFSRNPEPRNISDDEHALIKNKLSLWMKNGVFFSLPANGRTATNLPTVQDVLGEGLLRPPYPMCILEYTTTSPDGTSGPNELKFIIVLQTVGDTLHVDMMSSLIGNNGTWTPPAVQCTSKFGETTYELRPCLPYYVHKKQSEWNKGRDFRDDIMTVMETLALTVVYEFLYVVNNYNTVTTDIPAPDRLNRKRAKSGKAPLFAYKVLTIGKKKRKPRNLGGTHASPRSHLRRGYYRTSKHGVRHWVQACMVKGETPGFVHKDYKVEAEA